VFKRVVYFLTNQNLTIMKKPVILLLLLSTITISAFSMQPKNDGSNETSFTAKPVNSNPDVQFQIDEETLSCTVTITLYDPDVLGWITTSATIAGVGTQSCYFAYAKAMEQLNDILKRMELE
jgi:hypothetical protein